MMELAAAVGIFIAALVVFWIVPKRLHEPILLVVAGGALERGVAEINDGTGGWLLAGGALAYVGLYIWRLPPT